MSRNDVRSDPDTRERLLAATASLLRSQGYEGTGVKQIARDAEATLGSLYHFFPDGKEQLAAEALRRDADHYSRMLRDGLGSSPDPAEGVAAFAHLVAEELRRSQWQDSCLVAPTALEKVGRSAVIQRVWEESLAAWQEQIAAALRGRGLSPKAAEEGACTTLSMLQGAEVLSRMSSDDKALRNAASHLREHVRALLPSAA